jgi:hypothetical protein
MNIYVDIDDTICYYENNNNKDYSSAIPNYERIEIINDLFDKGNNITYWTARGTLTQIKWFEITYKQLIKWNCKFHELRMGKPAFDIYIDSKTITSNTYFNK